MKITVLGTGMVGQAHAGKLAGLGHNVVVGTHDVKETLAKAEPNAMGRPPFSQWLKNHESVKLVTFSEAAKHGEVIIEALNGQIAVKILKGLESELSGKLLIDVSNPLDFSKGYPRLFVTNDDSLGEQIQAELPKVKVVKAFNTLNADIQVDPKSLANGNHSLFIAGNDQNAKNSVIKLAKEYGWEDILDLGDIKSSRGMEMALIFWLNIMNSLGSATFNYKIAK